MTGTRTAAPLLGPEEVATCVGRPDVVLLQVDADSSPYHLAHLPGALPLDWHDELHDSRRRGALGTADLERLLQRKGVERDTHIVLYAAEDVAFAMYAYWLLRYHRHERVSVLDGGLGAWTRAGGALVDSTPPPRTVGPYRSPGPDESLRVRRDELVQRYAGVPDGRVLLDCRTPLEYAGRHGSVVDLAVDHHRIGGHVPGAVNLPSSLLLTSRGTVAPRERLEALFAERGVRHDSDVVVYCRLSERSSLLWFALHELLRHPRVRHYDGGWAEYGSLVDVPVARGRMP